MSSGLFGSFLKELIARKVFKIEGDGIKLFNNITYSAITAKSLAIFLQETGKKAGGGEKGRKYLFDIGYEAGEDAAKEMVKEMKLQDSIIAKRLKMVQTFMEMIGFGKAEVIVYNIKDKKALLHLTNHPVLEWGKKLYGKNSMVCSYYLGVYSAHAASEMKIKGAKLVETQCIRNGARFCEWSFGMFKGKGKGKK